MWSFWYGTSMINYHHWKEKVIIFNKILSLAAPVVIKLHRKKNCHWLHWLLYKVHQIQQERLKLRNTLGSQDQYAAQNNKYARPPIPSQPQNQKVFFQWHTQYDPTMISWLLMTWQCKEPGHQQSWYWPSSPWTLQFQHFQKGYIHIISGSQWVQPTSPIQWWYVSWWPSYYSRVMPFSYCQ